MGLDAIKSGLDTLSSRFLLVHYLPTAMAALFPLVLVLAGAPGQAPNWPHAWDRLAVTGIGTVLWVAFGLLVLALLLRPLQMAIVRLFEGYWPGWVKPWSSVLRRRHVRRCDQLAAIGARVPDDPLAPGAGAVVQEAGRAGALLRQRYPPGDLLPTSLGNLLAAAEARAGAAYGFDAVVAWPRLYPVLPDRMRAVVDDQRNSLDAAVVMAAAMAAAACGGLVLLAPVGWWVLLALVPSAGSAVAYRGAKHSALAYGQVIEVAFELYRFDLYRALHLPMPVNHDEELRLVQGLCLLWRQGVVNPAIAAGYAHSAAEAATTTGQSSA